MEGLLGFAEAFDRLAQANTSVFNENTSVFVVEVSARCRRRTPVDQVRDQLFQAMRNSDSRVRIVFVHRFHSDFHSMLPCKLYFQNGSNFGIPSNPTFQIR